MMSIFRFKTRICPFITLKTLLRMFKIMNKIIIGPNLKLKDYLKRKNRLAKVYLTQHMPLRY